MRRQMRVLCGLLALAAVCGAGAQPAAPRAGRPPSAPAPPPSDQQLEKAILERFARSKIAPNQFQVRVQGGVATLTGKTDVLQHKGVATRLAKAAGARQVVNRIEVSEAARQKASENLAKGRRRAQVKRAEPRSERRGP